MVERRYGNKIKVQNLHTFLRRKRLSFRLRLYVGNSRFDFDMIIFAVHKLLFFCRLSPIVHRSTLGWPWQKAERTTNSMVVGVRIYSEILFVHFYYYPFLYSPASPLLFQTRF